MAAGTTFDIGPKREVDYRIVEEEEGRLRIQVTAADGALQEGVVFVGDENHIRIVWEPTEQDDDASAAEGVYLKRAGE